MIEVRFTLEAWACVAVELGRRGHPEIAAPIRATVGAPTPDDQPGRFPTPLHVRWYDATEAREVVAAAVRLGVAGAGDRPLPAGRFGGRPTHDVAGRTGALTWTVDEEPIVADATPTKTRDERHHYRGFYDDGGVCRLRTYEAPGRAPVILVTDLPENTNTSVTNIAEYLSAELIARLYPARFDHPEPVVWIEHYPSDPDGRPSFGRPSFDRATFASWRPAVVFSGGVQRPRLGEPTWRRLSDDELIALTGDPALLEE